MIYSVQAIAGQIKKARKSKGISQRELSLKTSIPQSHISKIEQGKIDLQLSSLIQIARILDLELVLISRTDLSLFQSLKTWKQGSEMPPAYQLSEEEEND